jgi:uncharacterized RDD family membrane protein YckC
MNTEQNQTPKKSPVEKDAPQLEKSAAPRDPVSKRATAKGSRLARPDPVKRIAAGLVDGIPAYLIAFIPFLGGLISATYLVLRDGLPTENAQAQSLGKRLLGLKTIRLPGGEPCDYFTSMLRNLPFAVPALIMVHPGRGWIMGSFIWGALFLIELLLIIVDDHGERLGDRLAKTMVVDATEE